MTAVNEQVTSYIQQCIGEFCFTTPGSDLMKDIDGAKSWCALNSSQLAAVTDNKTQVALTQFLFSSRVTSQMFINIKLLYDNSYTWYLLNGERYLGGIRDQDIDSYRVYCFINKTDNDFQIYASQPNDFRNYICEFKDTSWCSNSSTTNYLANGKCYVRYDSETLSWFHARESCYTKGGDLATFNYDIDGFYILTYVAPFTPPWSVLSQTYWVGIRWNNWSWKFPVISLDYEALYTWWSNGKPDTYGQPCVCVNPRGIPAFSWEDCSCVVERQFVCLKIIPTKTTTAVPTANIPITHMTSTGNPATLPIEPCKFEALIIGLVLGITLPLITIIIALIIIIVHQRRQSREIPRNNESASTVANTTTVQQDRSATELYSTVANPHYQHLENRSTPGMTIRLYELLNQPETREYELAPEMK